MKYLTAEIKALSVEELDRIHQETLKVLSQIGIKVPDKECLKLCKQAGALVDKESSLVKIPEELLESIISRLNPEGRKLKDVSLRKLKGHISTQVFYIDHDRGVKRYGKLDDLIKGLALVEHLDNIAEANAVVLPADILPDIADIISYQQIFCYSNKPGGTYILSRESAEFIAEMARVMGRRECYLLETVSPLQFRKESLEIARIFAGKGQRLEMGPMVIGGASGPVTLAGTLVLQNAEILASLFLIYLLSGEFPRYVAGTHTMDLRTMLCSFGSPNQALLGIATAQLGEYYGLESRSNSGLTDALYPDFQAGIEKGITALFSILAGCRDIGCQGISGADQGFSMEQLVLDNEWLDYYNYIREGIEVNDITLASDEILQTGAGGNFLSRQHTVQNMRRSYWDTALFNREGWEAWREKDFRTSYAKAREFIRTVTEDYRHREPVIDSGRYEEINYIVKTAREQLSRK